MVIEIQEPKQEGYAPTLKFSKPLPFEQVIAEKVYEEPISGTAMSRGKEIEWNLYRMKLHSYISLDPSTGERKDVDYGGEEVGHFASKKGHEKLMSVPVGVKFKMYVVEKDGKNSKYTEYMFDLLDAVKEDATAAAKTPDVSADDKIKSLKDAGVPADSIVQVVTKEYDVSEAEVRAKLEAL